jgi:hypothetical protein
MIINVYNNARRNLLGGSDPSIVPGIICVRLFSGAFTFTATAGADPAATQLPNGNGYTRIPLGFELFGEIGLVIGTDFILSSVQPIQRVQLGTSGAAIQTISAAWVATGSSFTASHAVVTYRDQVVGVNDLYHLDFEGPVTWPVGQLYGFTFDAEGLVTYKAS